MRWLILPLLIATLPASGCLIQRCVNHYDCQVDEECGYGGRPIGRCLDDHVTGFICAYYFEGCPTNLKWNECGGKQDTDIASPLADYCVRPEYITDAARPADLGAAADGPGPD